MSWSSLTLALLAPMVLMAAHAPSQAGAPLEHRFASEPVNGKGLRDLSELRGKPVVVEFWGRR